MQSIILLFSYISKIYIDTKFYTLYYLILTKSMNVTDAGNILFPAYQFQVLKPDIPCG